MPACTPDQAAFFHIVLQCDTSRNLEPELPLGYARPEETGPTTNFVGNHMTQVCKGRATAQYLTTSHRFILIQIVQRENWLHDPSRQAY